jgi:outer membrane receptor protein involved in Fe transport
MPAHRSSPARQAPPRADAYPSARAVAAYAATAVTTAAVTATAFAGAALAATALAAAPAAAQRSAPSLAGRVADTAGVPLGGVRVLVAELGRAAVTGDDGRYRFTALAPGTYTVSFARIGRAPRGAARGPSPPGPLALDVVLREARVQLAPVQVTAGTAATRAQDSPQPTAVLDGAELRAAQGAALGETLEQVPGVRSLSMTTGIGKPVIRGMTHYRVVTLDNGQRSETQAWGHDHSPNVETATAERVEVIKGPASVLYGSDALGGVINVVAPPVPDASTGPRFVRGRAGTVYSHNVRGDRRHAGLERRRGGFGAPRRGRGPHERRHAHPRRASSPTPTTAPSPPRAPSATAARGAP